MGKVILAGLTAVVVLMSGCSATTQYETDIITLKDKNKEKEEKGKEIVTVWVDQITSRGWNFGRGVIRENYKYSFAVAATETLKRGYKYFTIVSPEDFLSVLKAHNVTNVQDAYDACVLDKKDGFMQPSFNPYTKCDSISNKFDNGNMLEVRAINHDAAAYRIEFTNTKKEGSTNTFDAKKVLESDLVKGLNKDYFVKGTRDAY